MAILETQIQPKVFFDCNKKSHVTLYKKFLSTGAWGERCPFVLEFPYLTIPDMIKDKLVHKFLRIKKVKYNEKSRY